MKGSREGNGSRGGAELGGVEGAVLGASGQWKDQLVGTLGLPSVLPKALGGFQCSGRVESITSEEGTCMLCLKSRDNGLCGRTRRHLG